jgi:hypothetical protein
MREDQMKNKSILCMAALAGVVLLAGSASAGTLTFNSWSNNSTYNNFTYSTDNSTINPNEFPLQEFDMYTWGIQSVNLAGQSIVSASITINNISNWSGNADELFIHLLDGVTNNNITQLEWTANTNTPVAPFHDYFTPAYYPTTANGVPYNLIGNTINNLIPNASVNNIALNDGTYSYTPTVVNGVSGPGLPSNFSVTNIDFNQGNTSGSDSGDVGGTFTYNLSAADLAVLAADIANGSNVALGFDADCHFWNDGVTFTINTQAVGGTPEPATLTLFALGLAGVLRRRMRK